MIRYFSSCILAVSAALLLLPAGCSRYETTKGDPLDAKVYTLSNGMKLFMSVNKDEPRVRAYVAVRVGGKDDPADNTGLAHYLEHMLFKGTRLFGTQDYQAEAPLLARIDSLFEVYRTLEDPAEREALYARIDAVSYEASKLAIPNEYDKLMSIIGSDASNAYTTEDVTCYVEEFPSNQIENWARIQADRFMNCVFRGFHTELEAVYEEKNTTLTNDDEKAFDALNSMLFPGHPYGTQTVIGTQDHLKNPSIRAIRKQKDTYYVPNNMAICLSGDFDPDRMVEIIEKYFGVWNANPNLPKREIPQMQPIVRHTQEVLGNESDFVLIGWRTPALAQCKDERSAIASSVLNNGLAGLLDIHVLQQQKVLNAYMANFNRADAGMFIANGAPKQGQTLEEVRDILLAEVEKLKAGEFPEELVTAAKANFKLASLKVLQNNSTRAAQFVNAFVDGISWDQKVSRVVATFDVTKEDVVTWANEYLTPENMAVVYKRVGTDPSIKRIKAPKITPIVTNRDKQSNFLTQIAAAEVEPIEPRFVDFETDMQVLDFNGLQLLYKHNDRNDLAYFSLWYDAGSDADPYLPYATDYLHFLGTEDLSASDFAKQIYALAYDWHINESPATMTIAMSGLGEYLEPAHNLLESLLHHPKADEEALSRLKANILRRRAAAKRQMGACNNALSRYMMYGPAYIKATTLTNQQVMDMTSEQLLGSLRNAISKKHKILYYGPATVEELRQQLASHHTEGLLPAQKTYITKALTTTPEVFVCQYDSRQFNYLQYSNRGESLILEQAPYLELFNEYFGSGMNSIVFQEMRESRALAYSASAKLVGPSFSNDAYYLRAAINAQNDKLRQAVEAFEEIIETMPESPENMEIARSAILNRLRTNRVNGLAILYYYLRMEELGLHVPREKLIYDKMSQLSMYDLLYTHETWIRGRTYNYAILGDLKDMDMAFLRTLGPVHVLTQEDIFGY